MCRMGQRRQSTFVPNWGVLAFLVCVPLIALATQDPLQIRFSSKASWRFRAAQTARPHDWPKRKSGPGVGFSLLKVHYRTVLRVRKADTST